MTGARDETGPAVDPPREDRIDASIRHALAPIRRQGASVIELSLARALAEQIACKVFRVREGESGAGP